MRNETCSSQVTRDLGSTNIPERKHDIVVCTREYRIKIARHFLYSSLERGRVNLSSPDLARDMN